MPIAQSGIESRQAFLIKEMEIIQKVFDKFDGWIVQIRVGVIVAVTGLVSLSMKQAAPVWWRVCLFQFILLMSSWTAKAILRWHYQHGYLMRREKIEEFLNNQAEEIWLFDPKDKHEPTHNSFCQKFRKTTFKPNTVLFHILIFILAGIGMLLLSPAAMSEESHQNAGNVCERATNPGNCNRARVERVGVEGGLGYKSMTMQDFELDKKELAKAEAKVAIEGLYLNEAGADLLVEMPPSPRTLVAGLFVNDAPRETRKLLLDSPPYGKMMRLIGRAVRCEWERPGMSQTIEDTCLAVDGAWVLPLSE